MENQTHKFAMQVLSYWARQKDSSVGTVCTVWRPFVTVGSWVPEIGGYPQDWSLSLGADLQEGSCCVHAPPGKSCHAQPQEGWGNSALPWGWPEEIGRLYEGLPLSAKSLTTDPGVHEHAHTSTWKQNEIGPGLASIHMQIPPGLHLHHIISHPLYGWL